MLWPKTEFLLHFLPFFLWLSFLLPADCPHTYVPAILPALLLPLAPTFFSFRSSGPMKMWEGIVKQLSCARCMKFSHPWFKGPTETGWYLFDPSSNSCKKRSEDLRSRHPPRSSQQWPEMKQWGGGGRVTAQAWLQGTVWVGGWLSEVGAWVGWTPQGCCTSIFTKMPSLHKARVWLGKVTWLRMRDGPAQLQLRQWLHRSNVWLSSWWCLRTWASSNQEKENQKRIHNSLTPSRLNPAILFFTCSGRETSPIPHLLHPRGLVKNDLKCKILSTKELT